MSRGKDVTQMLYCNFTTNKIDCKLCRALRFQNNIEKQNSCLTKADLK